MNAGFPIVSSFPPLYREGVPLGEESPSSLRLIEHGMSHTSPSALTNIPKLQAHLVDTFEQRHSAHWRYCTLRKQWFTLNQGAWRPDDTLLVQDLLRQLCRDTAQQAPHHHPWLGSAHAMATLEGLCQQRLVMAIAHGGTHA